MWVGMEKRGYDEFEEECYVGWEEVRVRSEKGRRETHYYLKKRNGGSHLAVIGKETSLRHMSYRLLVDDYSSVANKLRSRRDVVDWLNSLLPDSATPLSPQHCGGSLDGTEGYQLDVDMMMDTHLRKLGHQIKECLWLGSPWTCKKRRKHYNAFCRNGVKILVHGFVYVLAEENNRLVAYLDDMYEDTKGNKMVVVRWFHKIDEVGIDLPRNFNDREIFFSLCLQDLSIECIDGLATVLSPEHYENFLGEAKYSQLEPFMCRRQYYDDILRPLDITQVKGYWNQEIVRYLLAAKKAEIPDDSGIKPRKRLRLSRDTKIDIQSATLNDVNKNCQSDILCLENQQPDAGKSRSDIESVHLCTEVGSMVEVLSLDSGMRGCWFKASIIKKRNNKVKLHYHDVKDAENETSCLEEWVVASRVALHDEAGLRMDGRTTIRPSLQSHGTKVSWVISVGTVVDVWWHVGWWEGIVVQKESEERLRVYFPGEKREAIFHPSNLRPSQEWIGGAWKELNERPDMAAAILSDLMKVEGADSIKNQSLQTVVCIDKQPQLQWDMNKNELNSENTPSVLDLSKDNFLSQLKWNSSRKRKRSRFSVQKLQLRARTITNSDRTTTHKKQEDSAPPAMKVDRDNCKYISDSLFGTSVAVPPLTNLVMSR